MIIETSFSACSANATYRDAMQASLREAMMVAYRLEVWGARLLAKNIRLKHEATAASRLAALPGTSEEIGAMLDREIPTSVMQEGSSRAERLSLWLGYAVRPPRPRAEDRVGLPDPVENLAERRARRRGAAEGDRVRTWAQVLRTQWNISTGEGEAGVGPLALPLPPAAVEYLDG